MDEGVDPDPEDEQVEDHLRRDHQPCALAGGGDVAEAHRGEIVTERYRASVRERSAWLNAPESCPDITKYVEANDSRNSGTPKARAPTARSPGCLDLATDWIMGIEEDHRIEEIVGDLTEEFGQRIGPKQVNDEMMRVYGRFSGAPIQQFVPVLTCRIAREELFKRT